VTRYLLDTNIISDAIKPGPSEALGQWLVAQADDDLHTSSWTLAEVRRGILLMPAGRRRSLLEDWYDGEAGPLRLFAGRILPFDEAAAEIWATLISEGKRQGRSRSLPDMIIAATALANDCTLVTNNERDFEGVVPVLNPMR
jgi:predicted nucleic acid-binding protein